MPESVVSGGWLCCVREEDEINGCAKYEACSNVHVGSALVLRKSSRNWDKASGDLSHAEGILA